METVWNWVCVNTLHHWFSSINYLNIQGLLFIMSNVAFHNTGPNFHPYKFGILREENAGSGTVLFMQSEPFFVQVADD
jgi:hypothetical protein